MLRSFSEKRPALLTGAALLIVALIAGPASGQEASSPEDLRAKAKEHLAAYREQPQTPRGQARLNAAIDAYKTLIERFEKEPPSKTDREGAKQWLQYGDDLLQLGKIYGTNVSRSYANRILYLYGSDPDYRKLNEYARKGLEPLRKLGRTLQDLRIDWNDESVLLVLLNSKLSHLEAQYRLTSAWTQLYYAISIRPDENDRAGLARRINSLRLAIDRTRNFLGESLLRYPQAQWQCRLLIGIARRELGEFDKALESLEQAKSDKAGPPERFQAAFEIAKTHLSQGVYELQRGEAMLEDDEPAAAESRFVNARGFFERAGLHIDRFREVASQVPGVTEGQIDVYATLLNVYRYESWARSFKQDQARRAQLLERSEQLLVEFFEKYRDDRPLLMFFARVLAAKYEDRKDYEDLPSMILYALALRRVNQAGQGGASAKTQLDQAQQLTDRILQREDKVSKDLYADTLWLKANVALMRKDFLQAADLAAEVGRRFPESELGFKAAEWACQVYEKILAEAPSVSTRRKAIAALEQLLINGPDDWEAKSRKRWFDLGWHRERLAEELEGDKKISLLKDAVEAYRKVPEELLESLQADHQLLRIRLTLLEDEIDAAKASNPEAELPSQLRERADELARDLLALAERLPGRIEKVQEPERRMIMRNWGASAAFQAYRLRYDVLGRREALDKVAGLQEAWPETSILPIAAGYYIEKLIGADEIDQAIAATGQYEEKYGPERARALMVKLMNRIRDNIEQLTGAVGREDQLKRYRQAYYNFAHKLFEQAKADQAPPEQLYRLEQILANSLYEIGRYDEAMEHYQALQAKEEVQRKLQGQQISKRFDKRIEAVEAAAGRLTLVTEKVEDFVREAPEQFPEATRTLEYIQLTDQLKKLKSAEPSQAQALSRQAASTLVELLKRLKAEAIEQQQVDPINLLGVARVHAAQDRLAEAAKIYKRLVDGLTPRAGELYYTVWLEHARVMLRRFGDDTRRMEALVIKLRNMMRDGGEMGGLRGQFESLLARVRGAA